MPPSPWIGSITTAATLSPEKSPLATIMRSASTSPKGTCVQRFRGRKGSRKTLERYDRPDNALFVPEIGSDKGYARHVYDVLGRHGIGFSPFGLDYTGYSNYPLGAKQVDAETLENFGVHYRLLGPMAREWARLSYTGDVWGVGEADDRKVAQLQLILREQLTADELERLLAEGAALGEDEACQLALSL